MKLQLFHPTDQASENLAGLDRLRPTGINWAPDRTGVRKTSVRRLRCAFRCHASPHPICFLAISAEAPIALFGRALWRGQAFGSRDLRHHGGVVARISRWNTARWPNTGSLPNCRYMADDASNRISTRDLAGGGYARGYQFLCAAAVNARNAQTRLRRRNHVRRRKFHKRSRALLERLADSREELAG